MQWVDGWGQKLQSLLDGALDFRVGMSVSLSSFSGEAKQEWNQDEELVLVYQNKLCIFWDDSWWLSWLQYKVGKIRDSLNRYSIWIKHLEIWSNEKLQGLFWITGTFSSSLFHPVCTPLKNSSGTHLTQSKIESSIKERVHFLPSTLYSNQDPIGKCSLILQLNTVVEFELA